MKKKGLSMNLIMALTLTAVAVSVLLCANLVFMQTYRRTLLRNAETTSRQAIAQAGTGSSSVFSVVTLSSGQTLVGDVGCEIMLRIGSATCGSDGSTGLIDVTDGSTLSDGENLVTTHLYMVTISTRSVTATAGTTKLLVRGPYTIQ